MSNETDLKSFVQHLKAFTVEQMIQEELENLAVDAMNADLDTCAELAPVDTGFLRDELLEAKKNVKITKKPGHISVKATIKIYDDKELGKNNESGFAYAIYQNSEHDSKAGFLEAGEQSAENVLAGVEKVKIKGVDV